MLQLKMMSMSDCETVLKNQCLEMGEKIVDVCNFSPCLSKFDFTSQLVFECLTSHISARKLLLENYWFSTTNGYC